MRDPRLAMVYERQPPATKTELHSENSTGGVRSGGRTGGARPGRHDRPLGAPVRAGPAGQSGVQREPGQRCHLLPADWLPLTPPPGPVLTSHWSSYSQALLSLVGSES